MRNMILFVTLLIVMATSIGVGHTRMGSPVRQPKRLADASLEDTLTQVDEQATATHLPTAASVDVPDIGSIQVLNGCGITGAADKITEFLRSKGFDVKHTHNAASWNYPATMIISRTTDMTLANELEKHLKTGMVTLVRNRDGDLYDVTVVVGPDFEKKIKN